MKRVPKISFVRPLCVFHRRDVAVKSNLARGEANTGSKEKLPGGGGGAPMRLPKMLFDVMFQFFGFIGLEHDSGPVIEGDNIILDHHRGRTADGDAVIAVIRNGIMADRPVHQPRVEYLDARGAG